MCCGGINHRREVPKGGVKKSERTENELPRLPEVEYGHLDTMSSRLSETSSQSPTCS